MSVAISDPLIGSIIGGRYEVIRRIARGGMGTIYEVRNTRLGRTFALKTITAEAAQDPEVLARFRREADVVANLSHPHIVEVVDWDQLDDGAPFLVMEYLRGDTLARRVADEGALPWPVIARVSDQVLSALGVAHRAGVVHRDLKPDNIFLATDDAGEERVKLLDFGISKIRDSTTFQTTDAKVLGTPAYMAPEQAEGQHDKIGPATDVWAMGAIIYEMVTGSVAFAAPSAPAILYRVCHGRPTPASELRPDTPKALTEILDWALDLQLRLDDVEELRLELRRVLSPLAGVTWATPMRSRMMDSVRKTTPIGVRPSTPMPVSPRAPTPLPVSMSPRDLHAHRAERRSDPALPTLTVGKFAPASVSETIESPRLVPLPKLRSKLPFVLGGIGFVVSAVIVFAIARGAGDDAKPEAPVPTPTAAIDPPKPGPAPVVPATVDIKIESQPSGADIYRLPSELKVGVTPWSDKIDRADGVAVFVIKAAGYQDARLEIDLRESKSTMVALKRLAGPPPRRVPPMVPKTPPGRRKGEPVNPFDKANK